MKVAFITGSAGLIGSECVAFMHDSFDLIVGIDNDLRAHLFGESASTAWNAEQLWQAYPNYRHHNVDIRDLQSLEGLDSEYRGGTRTAR